MSALTFYRPSLFRLSSTCYEWVRLTAADIQTLTQPEMYKGQNVWFHLNNPIMWVRVVGVVVAVYEYEKRSILQLDDGSNALIRILVMHDLDEKKTKKRFIGLDGPLSLQAGMVIKAKGELQEWPGGIQVKLKAVELLKTTDDEVEAWKSMMKSKAAFWGKPWVLDEETIKAEDKRRDEELLEKLPKEKKFVGRKRKRVEGEVVERKSRSKEETPRRNSAPKAAAPSGRQEDDRKRIQTRSNTTTVDSKRTQEPKPDSSKFVGKRRSVTATSRSETTGTSRRPLAIPNEKAKNTVEVEFKITKASPKTKMPTKSNYSRVDYTIDKSTASEEPKRFIGRRRPVATAPRPGPG